MVTHGGGLMPAFSLRDAGPESSHCLSLQQNAGGSVTHSTEASPKPTQYRSGFGFMITQQRSFARLRLPGHR